MKPSRLQFCLAVFALALLALAFPSVAAAAPASNLSFDSSAAVAVGDTPPQFTLAVPGIFSIKFGDTAGNAEVDLPVLNAVGMITGLTISPSVNWNTLQVTQKQPGMIGNALITEAKVNVAGPRQGYSTLASARVEVGPGSAIQTKGKFGFRYDGWSRFGGITLQDVSLAVAADPVRLDVQEVNTLDLGMSIGSVKLDVPAANAGLTLTGYQVKEGRADWKAISIANAPNTAIQLGNVASLSQMQLSVAGPSASFATVGTAHLKVNAAPTARVEGQLFVINDPARRQSGVALSKGSMGFQVPGYSVQLDGINSIQGGFKIDTLSLAANPLDLTAEVNGVVVGGTAGFAFDQAKISYGPGGSRPSGFELTVTRSDAGYVMTTTTILPVAVSK